MNHKPTPEQQLKRTLLEMYYKSIPLQDMDELEISIDYLFQLLAEDLIAKLKQHKE
ncbi:hypothetical protein [Longirhabdus pacifica]|uniref:hypothetical protein n=1 Tax=Longirhabdus pacifica TaxID=2305227 RepID=UPI0013E8C49C|nr:hypothetical protein [Longirhabdus pacifica]